MIVMKFGGTSLGQAAAISEAARLVGQRAAARPVVVVSALSGVTDLLLALARAAAIGLGDEELTALQGRHRAMVRELALPPSLLDPLFEELAALVACTRRGPAAAAARDDAFMALGERLSAALFAQLLCSPGLAAQAFAAWELGLLSDSRHGGAEPLPASYSRLHAAIAPLTVIPVVTGFIAKDSAGAVTTLGRGGSDYSAAIIGAALPAERIEIWTDVDGIMTCDPSLVAGAVTIPELAFEEACELAYFGAKVLHPKMLLPAMEKDIPVQVLNTFKPQNPGTLIRRIGPQQWPKGHGIGAFSYKRGITAIHIHSPKFFDGNDLMEELFHQCQRHQTVIDIIATSVVSVSLTTGDTAQLEPLCAALARLGRVEVSGAKAVVCAVGGGMNSAGAAGRLFTLLGDAGIKVEMISQASSGISITFVVDDGDAVRSLRLLHREYIEQRGSGPQELPWPK